MADSRRERSLWLVVVVAFTLVSLYPIWSARFLPMQDYPEHLLQTHMLWHRNDPALDYREHFDFNLQLAPYATYYAVSLLLCAVMPIEVAGKVAVSLYILGVFLLVIHLRRRSQANAAPWGLLLLFPFVFNQQYYQGNINYFYCLPLLCFALLDHEAMSKEPLTLYPFLRHLLWQIVLFLTHPFALVIYISLAGFGALLSWKKPKECLRGLIPPMFAGVLFLLWFIAEGAVGSGGRIWWKPFGPTLAWYGYMFTGMRWFDGVDKLSVALWIGIGASSVNAFLASRNETTGFSIRHVMFLLLTTLAVFVLPFGKGAYSFINVRVAAVSYFFLAMLVGQVQFKGLWKGVFAILVAGLLIHSAIKQGRISTEIEEIVPIVEKIPANSRILPLVFDNNTPELENSFDIHLHDHAYYHVLVGGGLSPYMIKNPLFPVHYKKELNLTAPGEYSPELFDWELHGANYEYFLIRAAPETAVAYWPERITPISRSGKWVLFKKGSDA